MNYSVTMITGDCCCTDAQVISKLIISYYDRCLWDHVIVQVVTPWLLNRGIHCNILVGNTVSVGNKVTVGAAFLVRNAVFPCHEIISLMLYIDVSSGAAAVIPSESEVTGHSSLNTLLQQQNQVSLWLMQHPEITNKTYQGTKHQTLFICPMYINLRHLVAGHLHVHTAYWHGHRKSAE
jgi:hypothetical protein